MSNINSKKTRKYKNRTTYNRPRASNTYYKRSMPYHIYRDKRLDFIDIGLLTWLLSNSKISYVVNKNYVLKRSGLTENKFLKSWKRLQDLGFIKKVPIQGGVEWVINERPTSYDD